MTPILFTISDPTTTVQMSLSEKPRLLTGDDFDDSHELVLSCFPTTGGPGVTIGFPLMGRQAEVIADFLRGRS